MLKKWRKRFVLMLVTVMLATSLPVTSFAADEDNDRLLAFPGAEGGGMYTTGGRGGELYKVTTLADSGPGSLRDAVSESNRIIVFNVGGVIDLESPLKISGSNLTIAGQTAPGDGITIAGYPTTLEGDNIIMRYLRFRLGDHYPSEADAFGGRYMKDIIIDHSSFSWSVDEVLSIYGVENLTIQWSIISEAMHMSQHVKGKHGYGGIWGGKNTSFHHNLIAHNSSRNPALDSTAGNSHDFRNNVVYNWGHFSAYGGIGANNNLIENYYKPGPETQNIRFMNAETNGSYYIARNVMEGYPHMTADNWEGVHKYPDYIQLNSPVSFDHNPITTQSAEEAYAAVLAGSGAILPRRDSIDSRIINEVQNRLGIHINSQNEVGGGSQFEVVYSDLVDTDGDGIPDEWELAHGLDPENPQDAMQYAPSGYQYIEAYIHSIVEEADPLVGLSNPEVAVVAPVNKYMMTTGADVSIEASALAKNDASIAKVEFYANGDKIGEAQSAPYEIVWKNVPDGTHYIVAKAMDDQGYKTDSSTVFVHANTINDIHPWNSADIGNVRIPGHTQLGEQADQVIVKAAGDIGGTEDAFHYAYQQSTGNMEVIAKIEHITPTDSEAEAGIMFRERLDADSPFVALMVPYIRTGLKGVTLSRSVEGGSVSKIEPNQQFLLPYWVKLVRLGDQFTSLVSQDGNDWTIVGAVNVPLTQDVYIGLAADSSRVRSEVERYNKSVFSNVSITSLSEDYPTPPQQVQAEAGEKLVKLTWEEVEDAATYNVKVSNKPNGPYTLLASDLTETTFTHSDLIVGMTYYYVVSSVNQYGESFDSIEVNAIPAGQPETIYYIQHDYENMELGSTPTEYKITPNPQDDDHTVTIEAVPADSTRNNSTKALKVYDNAAGSTFFELQFPKQLATFVLEFNYMSPSQPGTSAIVHMKDNGATRTPIMIEIRKPQVPEAEDQYTLVYKNKANQDVKLTDPLENNRWYNFKIVTNVAANQMDIYLDHELIAQQVELKDDMRTLGLGYVMMGRTPGGGKGTMYFDNFKIYVEPIEAPKGLRATAGNNKVQLDWNVASGALTYHVKRSTTSGGPYVTIAEHVTETLFIDSDVINDTTYYYIVTAVGEQGESGHSNEASVTPIELPDTPPAPTGVQGFSRNSQAELAWDEIENATHYTIYRRVQEQDYEVIRDQYKLTSYRDGGLMNDRAYEYVITASNIGGESALSDSIVITPIGTLQTPKLSLTAEDQQIVLNWTGDEGAGFTIQRAKDIVGPYMVLADNVNAFTYTDNTVENGVPYYYIVTAKRGDQQSLNSQVTAIRAKANDGKPDAPSYVKAINFPHAVQLTWDDVAGADEYHVYRRLAGEENFERIAEHIQGLTYLDQELPVGITYEYTVAAVNSNGVGFGSPIAEVLTQQVITVAHNGTGDYETVQAAIDSIQSNNVEPITILIQPGEYREKIDIYRKHNISIIGLGATPEDTVLVYDNHAKTLDENGKEIGTNASFSMRAEANDFTAENLSIINDAGKDAGQAVALAARGDRQVYRNVRIIGWQDTLLAEGPGNRQYYVDSYIDGHVDYIFGSANAVFENSMIHSKAGGYITAASTQEGTHGYVFVDSRLTADPGLTGMVDLGRPWRPFANVVYIDTWMDDHIMQAGWNNWGNSDNELTARYGEYNSTGPGAKVQSRHVWTTQLTEDEAQLYSVKSMLNGSDGWDPRRLPVLPLADEDEETNVPSLEELISLVAHFAQIGEINNGGIANSLTKKLENDSLNSFINQVRAQRGKHISIAAADALLEYALKISQME